MTRCFDLRGGKAGRRAEGSLYCYSTVQEAPVRGALKDSETAGPLSPAMVRR